MNMLKRSLAMMLVLCMLIGYVPFNAFASEDGTETPVAPVAETEEVVETTVATVPPTTEETVPPTTEETVPPTTVETVPETTEETVPETTKETYPQLTMGSLTFVVPEVATTVTTASTEGVYTETAPAISEFLRVFHLDVGRKYFTVDQVKAVLDLLAANGYSHMELAIGNDGLRFLLDDMSVLSYDSATVAGGVKAGNVAYAHSGEWSQSEMDSIIAYADEKNIEIIPLINTPGHMDAILDAMEACGISGAYNGSARTVDLTNENAVEFTKALLNKYMAYFASKGCKYFNIGADEYANDISTGGWANLISNNQYYLFIEYVNELVQMAAGYSMRPIAFNDGIYYNNTTSHGTFDTRLIVASWTSGWSGFNVASTSFLSGKGHQILNTNERWYYVLGNHTSGGYPYSNAISYAETESVLTVTDRDSSVTPVGAMQCVWCDTPSVSYDDAEVTRISNLITTLSANNTDYFVKEEESEVTEPTPVVDETTKVSVKAEGVTAITVSPITEEIPVIEGAAEGKVLAWDMVPTTADGSKYEGEATVAVPVPDGWDVNRMGAFVVEADGVKLIEGAPNADGKFEFTMPHFSVGGTYEAEPAAETPVTVNLTFGGTATQTIAGENLKGTTPTIADTSIVGVTVDGQDEVTESYEKVTVSCSALISSNSTSWQETNYYYKDGDNYYPLYAKRSRSGSFMNYTYTYTWGYSTDGGNSYEQIGTQSTTSTSTDTNIAVYSKDDDADPTPASTTITFNGLKVGTTTVTVGDHTYNVVVSKGEITADLILNASTTYPDSSTNITVDDETVVSATTTEDGKLKITGLTVGETTVTTDNAVYTINVKEENLDEVDPVQVEWWITNIPVASTDGTVADGYNTVGDHSIPYSEITAQEANSENGVAVADFVPKTAQWNNTALTLWKATRLLNENRQTDDEGDDKTGDGYDFKYIRYYNGNWAVSYDRLTWVTLNSNDQLAAYYLQFQNVSEEVDILFKDWGYTPGSGENVSSVALSVAVVYPDGSLSPVESSDEDDVETIYPNASIIFNYWEGRDIGIVAPVNNSTYNISKITVTNGTRDQTSNKKWAATNTITWEKKENDAGSEWFDETTVWSASDPDANDTSSPMVNGAPTQDNVIWPEGDTAVLVLIYLEPVHYENNLLVQWVDDNITTGDNVINQMEVNVSSDNNPVSFYDVLKQTSALPTAGVGGTFTLDDAAYVTNSSNVDQTFNKDISVMPNVDDQYQSGLYEYVGADLDAEGKVLTLHYNLNPTKLAPMYFIDFGVDFSFSINDLVKNYDEISNVEIVNQPNYGTATKNGSNITYKPTGILQAIDVLPFDVTFDNGTTQRVRAGIAPATTVYYEESFLNYTGSWTGTDGAISVGPQATVILNETREGDIFGWDAAYAENLGASNGTSAVTSILGDTATFEFTGDGVQVFANCTETSGTASVVVKNKATGKTVNMSIVDTVVSPGTVNVSGTETEGSFSGQEGDFAGLPIVSLVDLENIPHATYTVTITKVMDSTENIYIDGVRVFNTVKDSNLFVEELEDNPDFYEMRDVVLKALNIARTESDDYDGIKDTEGKTIYEVMYQQVYDATVGANASAVVTTSGSVSYMEDATITRQDLLDNGPKNEVYLFPGDTLTFNVGSTQRFIQLGMKAPKTAVQAQIKVNNGNATTKTIGSSVDMFYEIAAPVQTATEYTVSVKNNSTEGILSVTLLKICDDPSFAFKALTAANVEDILYDAGYTNSGSGETTEPETPVEPELPIIPETPVEPEEPEEPEVVYADAKLTVNLVDYRGKKQASTSITMNGEEGTDAVFSAEAILEAAEAKMPKKYGFVNESAVKDVTVTYGDDATVTVKVGKVATLKVTYINLFGRVKGTATLTKVQNGNGNARFTAAEIKAAAPEGYRVLVGTNVPVSYGSTKSALVTVW